MTAVVGLYRGMVTVTLRFRGQTLKSPIMKTKPRDPIRLRQLAPESNRCNQNGTPQSMSRLWVSTVASCSGNWLRYVQRRSCLRGSPSPQFRPRQFTVFRAKNYRTEARILDEFGPHTLQKRTLKSGRKKKERKSNADPRCELPANGRSRENNPSLTHPQCITVTGLAITTFNVYSLC